MGYFNFFSSVKNDGEQTIASGTNVASGSNVNISSASRGAVNSEKSPRSCEGIY